MILNKRLLRELKQGGVRYGAMTFLIILSLSLVISMAGATDTVNYTIDKTNKEHKIEDGEFKVHVPLTQMQLDKLRNMGLEIEEKYYIDQKTTEGTTLRVFENRTNINRATVDKGTRPIKANDIFLEKHFASDFGLKIGDSFILNEDTYKVSGIGTIPDYSNVVSSSAESLADTDKFSYCLVSESKFKKLVSDSKEVEYEYSYRLGEDITDNGLKDYLINLEFEQSMITNPYMKEIVKGLGIAETDRKDSINGSEIGSNEEIEYTNLTYFLKAENNSRITSCKDDIQINKVAAIVAGCIVFVLIAYMLAVFSIHNVEKESAMIGTLYSMGYTKKELLRHYMILPIIVTGFSSIAGTIMGFLQIPLQLKDSESFYSYPDVLSTYPIYLILFGCLMPMIFTIAINYYVLNKKLKAEPLKLLRKEKHQHHIANVDLKNMKFINRYRIRQLLREISGNITLFCGLFVAILLMMLGFSIFGCVDSSVRSITDDVNYEYQYFLSYPPNKVPDGTEAAYTETLNANFYITDKDLEVSLQGIGKDNPYFDFAGELGIEKPLVSEKNEVYISDSVAYKFNWKIGDTITLINNADNKSYTFKVKKIVEFSTGLYIFMNDDNMREIFEQKDDYFNTLISDKAVNIDEGRVETVITKDEMQESSQQLYGMMSAMIATIVSVSVVIFITVMYLLLKMMIDKATFSISLIKVFGYTENEVKKLYLGSNLYTILITTIFSIPVTKIIISKIFPVLVANVNSGMSTALQPYLYIIMIFIILGSYLIVNKLLAIHLKKVSLVEILKQRE